ncbi:TPA: hypothetical protein DIU27_01640 [Candidatus Collierbacteria bacterium]|nr:MAG: hypothetical protein UW31_C0006G0102 [Candidatus Collierbacteria bacterium GW2011_GWA2_44_13]KKT61373.1 MAG: hypothetical protein UW56_C0027G0013 [Candidatus Collierbacteria bacterium GW2011_GWD1_44_27]KKT65330.1 MAG: hypothetical protein UW58_C0031G0014 [Candidatus Collierbacteria bacterium GW2011_GWC2_44_30]KKT88374.1 MAG: hypothetical protein UW88_C0011G0014 [Candidatus Collierbacteria bacterium GW2011_GWD2_45_10]HCQ31070.1 hypothetical protein [Candidatus Collierbacteria bacterium]
MNIRTITFDLDGLYFPDGKHKFMQAVANLGVHQDEVKRVFLKSDQMMKEYKTGKMGDEEFWTWAKHEWKLGLSWRDLIKKLIDSYSVDERVAGVVKKLRVSGYQTAVCSDNFPARVNGLQEKYGFLDNFDVKVFSYEVGDTKSGVKIFKALVDKSGSVPEGIVFADDEESKLLPAKEVGITTMLYSGFEKYLDDLRSVGVKI